MAALTAWAARHQEDLAGLDAARADWAELTALLDGDTLERMRAAHAWAAQAVTTARAALEDASSRTVETRSALTVLAEELDVDNAALEDADLAQKFAHAARRDVSIERDRVTT